MILLGFGLNLAQYRLHQDGAFVQNDMKICSLNQEFDSVLIVVLYMTTQADLNVVSKESTSVCGRSHDRCTPRGKRNLSPEPHAASISKLEALNIAFIENDYDPNRQTIPTRH
jgi:hypothetical protein